MSPLRVKRKVKRLEWRDGGNKGGGFLWRCMPAGERKNSFQLSPWWCSLTLNDMRNASFFSHPSLLCFCSTPLWHIRSQVLVWRYTLSLFFTAQLHGKACSQRRRVKGWNEVFPTCCKYTVSYSFSLVIVEFGIRAKLPSIHPSVSHFPASHYPLSPLLFPRWQATYWPLNPPIFLLWRHSKLKQRGEMKCLPVNP